MGARNHLYLVRETDADAPASEATPITPRPTAAPLMVRGGGFTIAMIVYGFVALTAGQSAGLFAVLTVEAYFVSLAFAILRKSDRWTIRASVAGGLAVIAVACVAGALAMFLPSLGSIALSVRQPVAIGLLAVSAQFTVGALLLIRR